MHTLIFVFPKFLFINHVFLLKTFKFFVVFQQAHATSAANFQPISRRKDVRLFSF